MNVNSELTSAVKNALAEILDEATFNLVRTKMAAGGTRGPKKTQCVSATELRDIYYREEEQVIQKAVQLQGTELQMSRLIDPLRLMLEQFVNPETDRIGHAFPTEGGHGTRHVLRGGGHSDRQFESSLAVFADSLVQAAAIVGVENTIRLLTGWAGGEPVHYRACTVLSGMTLCESVETQEGIRLVPLPLSTARLPRMPFTGGASPKDCLGLTLLTSDLSASPALFRPDSDKREQTVRSTAVDGIDFDFVCDGLSLQANCRVSWSIVWNDYLDATPLCLAIQDSWWRSGHLLTPLPWKELNGSLASGEVTIQPADDVNPQLLDGEELSHTLRGLRSADKKLRIAVGRWSRSKIADNRMSLEDQFIDLRIALELLFLQDFRDGRDQEMSFRMSLFGAWYLAKNPGERRSIRKSLRDAYSAASEVVHMGELRKGNSKILSVAQDLCREGILKLLREGPPGDWSDLILGADSS